MAKKLPGMQETQVTSPSQEDPSEKGIATHSSTLAWRIPWTEEPGGLCSMGSQRNRPEWATNVVDLQGFRWFGSIHTHTCESESRSVVFGSLQPQGQYSPWSSPGQNAGVGLPNPGTESRSPTLQTDSLPAEPPGKPKRNRGSENDKCLLTWQTDYPGLQEMNLREWSRTGGGRLRYFI